MQWRVRKPRAKHRALSRWHNWFAWHPVRVPTNGHMSGMTMVWFQRVKRKGSYISGWGDSYFTWDYKFKGEKHENK